MKKLYIILLMVLVVVLAGCDLFTEVVYSTNFTINGIVKDGTTGDLIEDAEILWTSFSDGEGKTYASSENGVFNISGGQNGTYSLRVSHTSYTTTSTTVEIDGTSVLISDMGLTEYNSSENVEFIVYPLTATADFDLNFDNEENDTDMSIIPVYARLVTIEDENNVPDPDNPVYTATITADGEVSFTGLPAAPNVEIGYGSFEDDYGNEFDETVIGTYDLQIDQTKEIADQTLTPVSGTLPAVTQSNLSDNFTVTDDITLEFNKALDSDLTDFAIDNGNDLTVVWATDYMSVTITPLRELSVDTNYTITASLVSSDDYSASETLTFTTEPGIEYVSSNTQSTDYDSNKISDVTSDLTVTFTKDITEAEDVYLYIEGTFDVLLDADFSISGDTLTIDPVGDLNYGESYKIEGTVYSSMDNGTNSDSFSLSFSTMEETVTLATPDAPVVVAVGSADYNTTSVSLSFDEVENATYYVAYARVDGSGTDWINVGYVLSGSTDYFSSQDTVTTGITAVLNDTDYVDYFDVYEDDLIVTPFAEGQNVEFIVVAYNGDDVYSDDSNIVVVEDETQTTTTTTDAELPAEWVVSTLVADTTMTFTLDLTEYIESYPDLGDITLSTDLVTSGVTIESYGWEAAATAPNSITIEVDFPSGTVIADTSNISIQISDTSGNGNTIDIEFNSTTSLPQISD